MNVVGFFKFTFVVLKYFQAWQLWKEDDMKALIDGSISEACFQEEILRCIHVGLLCVQELAKDNHAYQLLLECFVVKSHIFHPRSNLHLRRCGVAQIQSPQKRNVL